MKKNDFSHKSGRSRRRTERAFVRERLKGVFLRCEHLRPNAVRVLNISEDGLGLESSALTEKAKEIKILEGYLLVGQTKAAIVLRLVRWDEVTAGFTFLNPTDLLKAAIRVFFEAELAGAHMKEESPNTYKDSHSNQLSFELDSKNKIQKLTIHLLGNRVEWLREKKSLELLNTDPPEKVGSFLRRQLVQFARNLETLDHAMRQEIESILLGI